MNVKQGEGKEKPSFVSLLKEKNVTFFKKNKNPMPPEKSFMMGHPRLIKRRMPSLEEKATFISFQDVRNDSSSLFPNSFKALRRVKKNSMIGELRS